MRPIVLKKLSHQFGVLIALIGIWLSLSPGCSGKLYLLPPRADLTPPGIPRGAWRLCFDQIDRVINQSRHDAMHITHISNREWECAHTYLLDACGRWLNQRGLIDRMWQKDEVPYSFDLFRSHMRVYEEQCEEEGYDTDFTRTLTRTFYDTMDREAQSCDLAVCQ